MWVAGGAVDAVTKLLGFSRAPDFTPSGVTLPVPERQLLFAVAGAIQSKGMATTLPSVYRGGATARVAASGSDGSVGDTLERGVVHDVLTLADRQAEVLARARQLAAGSSADQRASVVNQLRAAAALADGLLAALGGSAGAINEPFVARILGEEAVQRALDEGTVVLLVELVLAGGASYVRKNFFSGSAGTSR